MIYFILIIFNRNVSKFARFLNDFLMDIFREDIPSSEKFQDPKNSSSVDRPSIVESPSQRDIFRKPPITVV